MKLFWNTKRMLSVLFAMILVTMAGCGQQPAQEPVSDSEVSTTAASSSTANSAQSDTQGLESNASESVEQTQAESNTSLKDDTYLFESSDKMLLKESDILGYDTIFLQMGVNEIYARHGYSFNTPAWQTYFEGKSWYSPNETFNESELTEIEKKNIAFLKASEPTMSDTVISIDLDEDGTTDAFDVTPKPLYKALGEDQSDEDALYYDSYMGTLVTDFDINDGERELLIYDSGPSADYTIQVVIPTFDAEPYITLGMFPNQYFDHEIDGKGNVAFGLFHNLQYVQANYTFANEHLKLTQIIPPEFTYTMDTDVFKKGERVSVTVTNDVDWDAETIAVKIQSMSEASHVETFTLSGGFETYFQYLIDHFDEVDRMYYGD